MDVYILDYDQDRHGAGCRCGVCNSNGKSYGVAIFNAGLAPDEAYHADPLAVAYGPSYDAAAHNARLEATQQGWRIVPVPEEGY